MADSIESDQVLRDILKVLERIEHKLNSHPAPSEDLEDPTSEKEQHTSQVKVETAIPQSAEPSIDGIETSQCPRKGTPTNKDVIAGTHGTSKVPYGQWSINRVDYFFDPALSKSLARRLRDCWGMPDDDRLPLRFFKSNILQTNAPWGTPFNSYPTNRHPIHRQLDLLCHFDGRLRKEPGNDFVIIDFDESENTRIYRLGEDAIGPEFEVQSEGSSTAPWSRVMYVIYCGLLGLINTVQLVSRGNNWR